MCCKLRPKEPLTGESAPPPRKGSPPKGRDSQESPGIVETPLRRGFVFLEFRSENIPELDGLAARTELGPGVGADDVEVSVPARADLGPADHEEERISLLVALDGSKEDMVSLFREPAFAVCNRRQDARNGLAVLPANGAKQSAFCVLEIDHSWRGRLAIFGRPSEAVQPEKCVDDCHSCWPGDRRRHRNVDHGRVEMGHVIRAPVRIDKCVPLNHLAP